MTPAEASEILTLAAAFDRRKVGRADAIAWADALNGLEMTDCAEAVRAHFRESTEYLMPAHVRAGVRAVRAERIRNVETSALDPHDVDPADLPRWLDARRKRIDAVASGQPVIIEPTPATARDVGELLSETLASLPKMPAALPQADLAGKRLAGRA